mmetsp:Transcript_4214/g.11369  ORF Transcript_4214/g.11369 Transcript_4214/m.11369 type:complete len:220 (-) Transcript_4214:1791-2450(-)
MSSFSSTCSEEANTAVSIDKSISLSPAAGSMYCMSSSNSTMPWTLLVRILGASATRRDKSSFPSSSSSGMSSTSASRTRSSYLLFALTFCSASCACCSCLRLDTPVSCLFIPSPGAAKGSAALASCSPPAVEAAEAPINPPTVAPALLPCILGGAGAGRVEIDSFPAPSPPSLFLLLSSFCCRGGCVAGGAGGARSSPSLSSVVFSCCCCCSCWGCSSC